MTETQITETETEPTTPVPLATKGQATHILGRRTRHQPVKIKAKGPVPVETKEPVTIETEEPVEPEAAETAAAEAQRESPERPETPETPESPETQETPETTQASESDGFDEMLVANVANMDAFARATEALMKGMADLNAEMTTFTESRVQANFERAQSLLETSDPTDVVELQADFARSAAEQYFTGTTRLLNLAAQMSEASWAPIMDRVNAGFGLAGKK